MKNQTSRANIPALHSITPPQANKIVQPSSLAEALTSTRDWQEDALNRAASILERITGNSQTAPSTPSPNALLDLVNFNRQQAIDLTQRLELIQSLL